MATRAQIRTKVRREADQEDGTAFIPDTECNDYINDVLRWVYGELVAAGVLLPKATTTITATGASPYNLPAGFLSVLGVHRVLGSQRTPLNRLNECDYDLARSMTGVEARLYDVVPTVTGVPTLALYPNVSSGSYEVRYIPTFTDLSSDVDVLVWPSWAEELVVVSAAIKCMEKEGIDTKDKLRRQAVLLAHLEKMAQAGDATQPGTVQDTVRRATASPVDGFSWVHRGE